MENREILIANTRTQKRSKITTAATTLGELKAALAEAGIDYSGMTFTEGISKTQLLDDATQLPQNVMYKGNPTNNLVILLTNTKKNIASGAGDRAAAYAAVKDNNLQDAVKEHFGRNFTQVPTDALWDFIGNKDPEAPEEEAEETEEINVPEDEDMMELDSSYTVADLLADTRVCSLEDSIFQHVAMLADEGVLKVQDINDLVKDLEYLGKLMETEAKAKAKAEPVSTSDGSITDDDIDNMIDDLM